MKIEFTEPWANSWKLQTRQKYFQDFYILTSLRKLERNTSYVICDKDQLKLIYLFGEINEN